MVEPSQSIISIYDILQLAGLSAIIGGVTSAVVTFLVNMKEFSKKRHSTFIEDKIDVYSYIIYCIDAMRYKGEALKLLKNEKGKDEPIYAYSQDEWEETIKKIDNKINDKYFLLTHQILEDWVIVKTLFAYPLVSQHIEKLRSALTNEYNDVIVPEYEKMVSGKINKIPSIKNLNQNTKSDNQLPSELS